MVAPMPSPDSQDPERSGRLRAMLDDELETAWMYSRLADLSDRTEQAETLRELAESELTHARHWADRLQDLSLLDVPVRPSLRTRALVGLARVAGVAAVLPRLRAAELDDIRRYESEPEAGGLAEEEREHRETLGELAGLGMTEAEHGFGSTDSATTFRAALFGFNDGLVSNISLIAGVAGAAVESNAVLIAGIAGWLAGAFSMGSGEYISVRSQRELFEYQIARERMELELDPEEERRELVTIYRRKGISEGVATDVVDELMQDRETALDTLAREELGLDPNDLGAPWPAAIGSFVAFSVGALIPLLPFFFGTGYTPLVIAIVASVTALGLAGVFTSILTGRNPLYAGGRMILIGVLATAVTFGIGSVIPVDL